MTQDWLDRELRIRPANPEDARDVLAIWTNAAEWQRARGIDQWNPAQFSLEGAAAAIRDAEVYLAELGHDPVGTYLIVWSDSLIWKERDNAESGYIHKLAVRRDLNGMGIGLRLLAHAERQIAGRGKRFIRLDCMADNERLNRYYLGAGYTLVGRSDGDGWSANLYEKQAGTV